MVGLLDADGGQIFRRHPGDGWHVVAGRQEEVVILLVVQVRQPSQEYLVVLKRRLKLVTHTLSYVYS